MRRGDGLAIKCTEVLFEKQVGLTKGYTCKQQAKD